MESFTGALSKSCSAESHKIYRKTSMQESLFDKFKDLKKTPAQAFFV